MESPCSFSEANGQESGLEHIKNAPEENSGAVKGQGEKGLVNLGGNQAGTGLGLSRGGCVCPELILLDFDGRQAFLKANDSSLGNQLQGALIVELGGPTDGDFEASPWQENMLRGE
jgi:hypothetical protein